MLDDVDEELVGTLRAAAIAGNVLTDSICGTVQAPPQGLWSAE